MTGPRGPQAGDGPDETVPHPLRHEVLHGHTAAERAMLEAYRSGRLHHAWLIGGAEGIGKATLAWHFARFVLANPDAAAPEVQQAESLRVAPGSGATQRLMAGSHGDLVVLDRKWNDKTKKLFSEIRVDDVRAALGLFQRASTSGGYRICIIDTAEDLNRSSANALLKAVEDPPPRSLFLIVAHRPGQVMPTLVSRARRLMLAPLTESDAATAVLALGEPWASMERARLTAAASQARGSVGEMLRRLDGSALELDEAVTALLSQLPDVNWSRVHRLADRVGMSGEQFAIVHRAIDAWLENQLRLRTQAGARALVRYADCWEQIRAAAREAEVLNLDRRPVLLTIFAGLARASSASAA